MAFDFQYLGSDSPFVECVWRTRSIGGGFFTSVATSHLEMTITRQANSILVGLHGPETRASRAPIPTDAEFMGIQFKLGVFMPYMPVNKLVNGGLALPVASGQTFWMHGSAWEYPTFDNVDTFVARLIRQGILAYEPLVMSVLQGNPEYLSVRSVQRRFLRATGITHGTMYQIERAHRALSLLQQGVSILDTVNESGFYDQSHLTRALKQLMGQTPAQALSVIKGE